MGSMSHGSSPRQLHLSLVRAYLRCLLSVQPDFFPYETGAQGGRERSWCMSAHQPQHSWNRHRHERCSWILKFRHYLQATQPPVLALRAPKAGNAILRGHHRTCRFHGLQSRHCPTCACKYCLCPWSHRLLHVSPPLLRAPGHQPPYTDCPWQQSHLLAST